MGNLSEADFEDTLSGFKDSLDRVFDYYRDQDLPVTVMAGVTLQWALLSLLLNTLRDGNHDDREEKVKKIVDSELQKMVEFVDTAINIVETEDEDDGDEHSES